MEFEIWQLF